jgi:hypothetical protein
MSTPSYKVFQRKQLKADFQVVMQFFGLPPEIQKIAWTSAENRIGSAAACYRAIVNSLPT